MAINDSDRIFNSLMVMFSNRKIDATNIAIVTMSILEEVDKLKKSDPEKKQITIDILNMVVEKSGLVNNTDIEAVKTVIDLTMPSVIDGFLAATEGQLKIRKRRGCCF